MFGMPPIMGPRGPRPGHPDGFGPRPAPLGARGPGKNNSFFSVKRKILREF